MADVEILHPTLENTRLKDEEEHDAPSVRQKTPLHSTEVIDEGPDRLRPCTSYGLDELDREPWTNVLKGGISRAGGANEEARNAPSASRTRYGAEPMPLIFGNSSQDDTQAETARPLGKHKVMSASEPQRASLNIKRIGPYDLIKTIGSGSTGKVKLAVQRETGERMAVKIVPRRPLESAGTVNRKTPTKETTQARERRILREAAILNLIDHRSIVKLRDFLITPDYFCLFFEYVEGVQLLDYIIMHGKLRERRACSIFRQILSAVDYCHHYSIVHRDLKIENILVEERTGAIKLLDFGLSNFYRPEDNLSTFCGSLYFAAPELLCGHLYTGPEVDVWSLGIILFVLVTGRVPFDDKNLAALHEKIKACNLQIPDHVSDGCKELLLRMICRDPQHRATMDDVIFHPWTNQGHTSVPAYLPPERTPLEGTDEAVISYLLRDFDMQYTEKQIREILEDLIKRPRGWETHFAHPVVSLYFLARDKLYGPDGQLRAAPIRVDATERSRSLPYINNEATDAQNVASLTKGHIDSLTSSIPRSRTKSMSVTPSTLPTATAASMRQLEEQYLNIKTVYLRGFFSVNTTSSRSPMAIRNEIQQYLMLHNIHYEDHRSYFVCEHRPSVTNEPGGGARIGGRQQVGRVLFEIHIVRLGFIGTHGLQFKRIQGDVAQFKNLQTQMISSLRL